MCRRVTTPYVTPVVRPDFTTRSPSSGSPSRRTGTSSSRIVSSAPRPSRLAIAQSPASPRKLRTSRPHPFSPTRLSSNRPGWTIRSPSTPLAPWNTCQFDSIRVSPVASSRTRQPSVPAVTRSCPMLTPGTSTSSRRLRSVLGGASTAVGSGANRRSTMSVLKRMPLTVKRLRNRPRGLDDEGLRLELRGDGELQRELVRRLAVDDLVADAHGGDVRVFEVFLGDLLNRRLDLCPVLQITLAHARNLRGAEDVHTEKPLDGPGLRVSSLWDDGPYER